MAFTIAKAAIMKHTNLLNILLFSTAALTAYRLLRALYNISPLHPLSKVPGPRLAAASYLPEFWHDVIKGGRYTHRIREMHEQYGELRFERHGPLTSSPCPAGPIVRINPDEIHCSDPAFIDDIYPAGGKRRDKPQHQVRALGAWSANIFGCADHDTHRIRRAGWVARFFSRSMVAQLEEEIRGLVGRLCDKLLAEQGRGRPIDVTMAYSCLASDIISDYCFGQPFGLLAQEEWTPNFRQAGIAVVRPAYYFRFFPFLSPLVGLGKWFVAYLPEDLALFIRTLEIDVPALIAKTRAEMDAGISSRARPTVFMELMQSDLPASEKTHDRLKSEAFSLLGAATETTSWALGTITYYLLSQPETMARLRAELETVVHDPRRLPPLTTLERLPYLGAVIQEGLRLSYGVSSRTARIATHEDLIYRGEFNKKPIELVLPRGYPVGMSPVITHHDETIFPDSNSFVPERWLDESGRRGLDKAFLSFSKGSRVCLGMK